MKYELLNSHLFQLNRERFVRELKPNTIAIFNANDMMPRTGDQFFPFRQNADLFYLSGLDQEETVLVLYPDAVRKGFREIVFTKKTNPHIVVWEGHKYTKKEAKATSGIQTIYWLEDMPNILNSLILKASAIYLNGNENSRFDSPVLARDARFAIDIRAKYPMHTILRSQPIMQKLRMIKSNYEVAVIQHAINITKKAFKRVLEFVRPGVMEYEIEAEMIHEFIRNRATGHAYEPIIASGKNACILHYNVNNQMCRNGDLLLMDFGAEYANYAADLTRTIPVNGQFTTRQRDIYQSVLKVLNDSTELLVPGITINEYHKMVGKIMESELIRLKLLDREAVKHQNPDQPLYRQYFMHGTSHHLGLDVHDLGNFHTPIQAGMLFTSEPGIYIPKEGIGIRLENDILVTDNKPMNLMKHIPIEIEEIEEYMNAGVMM